MGTWLAAFLATGGDLMRLAEVPRRLNEVAERYQVPERLRAAGETACQSAEAAYRAALNHPKTSIGGILIAAALVGGLLWYLFGNERQQQERQPRARVRAGGSHRRRAKASRAAAAG
jgi:hypothetical protein